MIFAELMRNLSIHKATGPLYLQQCDFCGIESSNPQRKGRYVSISN